MYTNKAIVGRGKIVCFFAEQRLCFYDLQRRHDLLGEAEQTQGKMESNDPLQVLKSNTEKLAADIAKTQVGWGEWLRSFCSTNSALDKKMQARIMQSAEAHIQQESNLAVGKIQGLFLRGKRRLYLVAREKIAASIRNDLTTYLQSKQQASVERESRFSRLAKGLRSNQDPLPLRSTAERQKLLQSLQRVGNQLNRKQNSGPIPKEWQDARETEQMLKQQLLVLDIVAPAQLDDELEKNSQGGLYLQNLITSSPKLQADKELRTCLLSALKTLRTGKSRYYRLQKFMEKDANVGTVEQRLKFLKQDANILGRKLRLALGESTPTDAVVVHKGDGFLVLRKPQSEDYYVVDLQVGEVTYKDANQVLHDAPLKESSFMLN